MNYRYGRPRGTMRTTMERGDPRKFVGYLPTTWHNVVGGYTLNGSDVSAMANKFAGTNAASQATAANQAALSATGFNGKPCLDHGAAGTKGYATANVTLGPYTAFFVGQGNASSGYMIVGPSSDVPGGYFNGANNRSSYVQNGQVGASSRNVSAAFMRDSIKRTVAKSFDGTHAGHKLYSDGVDLAAASGPETGNPGTGTSTGALYLGCQQAISGGLRGLAAEWITYGAAMPADIVARVSRGRNAYWQIANL